jgi:hypothetical protein
MNNRPKLQPHSLKSGSREAVFSPSWIFASGGRSSPSGSDLGRSTPEAEPNELRFCLSHFPSRRTSSKSIGPRAAPKSSCGDAPLVNAIRSSAMDAAASRRTTSITTGLTSAMVAAPVASTGTFGVLPSATNAARHRVQGSASTPGPPVALPGVRRRGNPSCVLADRDWIAPALNAAFPTSGLRLPVSRVSASNTAPVIHELSMIFMRFRGPQALTDTSVDRPLARRHY